MKHFISFQKKKGLFVLPAEHIHDNWSLVHQINHELMKYGYVMTKELFDALIVHSGDYLDEVYNDLRKGIVEVVGQGGYEPIYKGFPQSVMNISHETFVLNAMAHYWSMGRWRPEDAEYINREFKIEPILYKSVGLLTKSEFSSIFTDLVYSLTSLSTFDKKVVDWFIGYTFAVDFSKIKFKETLAYIGKRYLDNEAIVILPTKDATNVLRIWSAYSGGDEGLKENTRFKNPSARQREVLSNTLNGSYNLEESFKTYREKWLRMLFYLNPRTPKNVLCYPELATYADLVRNNPKVLKTFNSRVEQLLNSKSLEVFELLKKRRGVFTRRLDHCVRVFGEKAVTIWLETKPDFNQLIIAYNHFTDRDKASDGRGAVLASAGSSQVVTYAAQAPLSKNVVDRIKSAIMAEMGNAVSGNPLQGKRIYINRSLYYRPMAVNNRASSLTLDSKANGTVEVVPAGKTIRMYVHWHGKSDLDLSGLVLTSDNEFKKVGWNGYHDIGGGIVYSGDNRGINEKNAEYLDVTPDKLGDAIEWVITECRIYAGRDAGGSVYSSFREPVKAGWMLRNKPEANLHWLPETIANAQVIASKADTAFLMALHVPSRNIAYLDLAMSSLNVSGASDAIKMRSYLNNLITIDDGAVEVKWDKINQGHILHLLGEIVVDEPSQADIVFDENTTWESVAKYL